MKFHLLIPFFCLAIIRATAAAIPEVELINDAGDELQPSSTLEVRFARPIIAGEGLTGASADSPLVFKPELPGQFTWLSRQSGVFVPDQAPPLGSTYAVTIRPDLKAADGKSIGRKFRVTLRTPAFGLAENRREKSDDELSPNPSLRLIFNAEVPAEAKYFSFVDDRGNRLPATVRYLTTDDSTESPREEQNWEKRWRAARSAPTPSPSSNTKPETFFNCLVVSPEKPLGSGDTWQLEVAKNFPSRSGQYRLTSVQTVPVGEIKPFVIKAVTTESHINSGRSVTLDFSAPIAPDVMNEETGTKFFHIEPPVENLKLEEGYKQVTLRGGFARGQTYRVEVDATVIAENGMPLEGERTRSFQFQPVKPRLYLPEIDGAQIASGQRKIPIETINLKTVHVRARLLAPDQVAPAIEAFAKYFDVPSNETDPDEVYTRVPEDAILSASLVEQTIELPAGELDRKQMCAIEWDKIVGAQKPAAVFLTVEGEPRSEIGGRRPGGQALVQVTDLGILWKKTANELRVNVFSHASGQAVTDAQVALLGEKFEPIFNGKTDNAGLVSIPLGKVPSWLAVQRDPDVHAIRMGARAAQIWLGGLGVPTGYREWKENAPIQTSLQACLFTDRPLYQPTDEVHVKGIVREITDDGLRAAANRSGTLNLSDDRANRVAQKEIRTDEHGAFDTTFPLESAETGAKTLALKFSDDASLMYEGSTARFQVAAYQPNAFELKVVTPARLAPGETLRAGVTGKYFFGGGLTQAQVRWTLRYFTDEFRPDGFDEFSFGRFENEETTKPLTLRGEGALGNEYTIAPQLPEPSGAPKRSVLTVEVTDANQQTVSETQRIVHDASQFYLGIAPLSHDVVGVGDDVSVRAVAVQPDGQPLAQSVKINAELFRLHYQTTRVQGAGKAVSFKTERTEEKIGENSGETVSPRKVGQYWQAPDEGGITFKAPKPGQYCVRVTAKDASGHEAISERNFYVSGDTAMAWDYANTAQVTLVPDKEEYHVGDKARILVKTPIAGEARVSIERGENILREQRIRLEGNAPSFEVPIKAGDAPNIFATLVIIRGADASTRKFKIPESRYGACVLRVVKPETRLQVKVTPARPEVQPGAEVESEISVRDGRDSPVADAEVTFFAVDDGVLALTGYTRPDPRKIFESPIPLIVRTGLTLSDLLPEDPAALTFDNKGYLIGGGGAEGPGAKLRRNFPGTAYWMPSLRTDRDGKVRVRFTAPDALTRYRLVAVAHAGDDKFGSGESNFTIHKPLMILSALGQFANTGDDLIARAVVRNETGADIRAAVALALDVTAESAAPTSANIEIKNGEGRTVEFPVKLRHTGKAEWKWSVNAEANGRKFSDEMTATLDVGSPMLQLREIYFADARSVTTDLLQGVNPQLLEGSGRVSVTVANTRLASLRESANHLLQYPYGCAEQTTSSLIPWIVLPKLKPVLPDLKSGEESAAISKGLEKLKSMQTSGGGIAFWPGGQRSQIFVSAYAAVALAMLPPSESGPDRKKLLKFLSDELRGSNAIKDETKLHDRILALYALALSHRAEPSYHEEFFRRRAELSYESRALLALAILESKGPAAMIKELLDKRKPAPEHFSWYAGSTRTNATELLAWTQFDPQSSEIAPLTAELLRYRRNGRWGTTQENAWALLALARYYELVEHGGGGAAQGEIVFNGSTKPFDLSESKPAQSENFAIEEKTSASSLSINNPQKSTLFADSDFKVYPPLGEQPRQDRGFAVSRSYRKIGNDGALVEPRDLKVGDRILVSLRVEISRPARFVAIDDPLPAIFEAVNPAFVSRATGEDAQFETESFSDYREMRADRVLIFCDSMPAGAHTYHYLARVRSAGIAAAGATKVEEMYRPERFGLSELVRVSSQPAESK